MSTETKYGLKTTLDMSFKDAVEHVTTALKAEGFGILTEINVQATLKQKLDVDMPEYIILGACNPKLAHEALQHEPDIGLLLPCNVIVHTVGEETQVAILDPSTMTEVTDNPALRHVAEEARTRLDRVIQSL